MSDGPSNATPATSAAGAADSGNLAEGDLAGGSFQRTISHVVGVLGIFLCFFTIWEVNFSRLQPQSALAVFVGVGLTLCFLTFPIHPRLAGFKPLRWLDVVLAIAAAGCCLYVIVQTEPV